MQSPVFNNTTVISLRYVTNRSKYTHQLILQSNKRWLQPFGVNFQVATNVIELNMNAKIYTR